MSVLENYELGVAELAASISAYKAKPTKVGSRKIRKLSLELEKSGIELRKFMVKEDKSES